MKWLALVLALAAVTGCKAKQSSSKKAKPVAGLTDVEVQRGEDACKMYIDKVCGCAASKPDLAQQCQLAKSLPDAMHLALSVATNPESKPDVANQSFDSVRQTVAECITETAKLPSAGCN